MLASGSVRSARVRKAAKVEAADKSVRPDTNLMTHPTLNSPSAAAAAGMPTVAIVGRPNVGKSTLFNRLVGSRRAIVGDEPGITRDRLYGEAEWRGRHLRIVDTGGILPEDKDFIPAEIFRQAKVALEEADAVIMVVDGRTEMASPDIELARQLIRSGKPLFLAVNKVDTDKQQTLTDEFHRLGIRKLFPISAENARGLDDLLDAVLEVSATAQPTNHGGHRGRRGNTRSSGGPSLTKPKLRSSGIPTWANPRC